MQPIQHLFRTEYRKIISVLCKRFGFAQIKIAEDIASDTFLAAAQSWGLKGMPANPVAWLYHVINNKAINYLKRHQVFENKVVKELSEEEINIPELDLSPQNIIDSQLQMMFAICHPSIPVEAQVGLALRILCGFGIEEIADAFLTNKETINKRLYRAENILQLYNRLLQIQYSPVAALNRTYALAKANGKQKAIAEAEKLRLNDNHFYFTLLGELYTGIDNQKAKIHFDTALALAKTQNDKQVIQKKIGKL